MVKFVYLYVYIKERVILDNQGGGEMKIRNQIIIITLFVIAVIGSCDRGTNPPPPPDTIKGQYTGTYSYSDNNTPIPLVQAIKMIFYLDNTYEITIDTASEYYSDFCICETFGEVTLDDRLNLDIIRYTSNKFLCDPCDTAKSLSLNGLFLLDRSNDVLVMTQQITDSSGTIIKQIRIIELYPI